MARPRVRPRARSAVRLAARARLVGGVDGVRSRRRGGGEMGEDSLDEVGGLDACDDAQRPATHGTVLDIEMEDSVEALHPAHGGNEPAAIPARSGCADRAPSWRRRCGIEAAIENDFLIPRGRLRGGDELLHANRSPRCSRWRAPGCAGRSDGLIPERGRQSLHAK